MASPMWFSVPSKVREIRGPFPHSVLLLGRPIDHGVYDRELIRQQKVDKIYKLHDEEQEAAKLQKLTDLRHEFITLSDRKVQARVTRNKVRDDMLIYSIGVEQRRERLKELLAKDDVRYREESDALEVTVATRMKRNREKIKAYREKKEAERLQFVQSKYMQQLVAQCDDFRTKRSKHLLLEAAADRVEQMKANAEARKEAKRINDIYHEFGQFDFEARACREETETREILRKNCEGVAILQKQMAAKEDQKRKEKELKQQEQDFLAEQRRRWEEEDALIEERKLQEKMDLRDMYNRILRNNRERHIRDLKSELVFDMKLIEENLKWKSDEEQQAYLNKKLTREEMQKYLKYLDDVRKEHAKMEKVFDEFRQCEIKKAQDKQDRQWQLEREARSRLRCDVIAAVNTQRCLKQLEKEEAKTSDYELAQYIAQGVAETKQIEDARIRKQQEENRAYGNDLVCQIDYNRRQREAEEAEHRRLIEKQNEAELEYQKRITDLMNDSALTNTHPARLKLCKHLQGGPPS